MNEEKALKASGVWP